MTTKTSVESRYSSHTSPRKNYMSVDDLKVSIQASTSSDLPTPSISRDGQSNFPASIGLTDRNNITWKMNIIKYRPLLKFSLFIQVLFICILVSAIFIKVIHRKLYRPSEWYFYSTPPIFPFNEMAVSTSSEECNEVARLLIVERFSIHSIALASQLCLAITSPHQSGIGGASVAVYVNAKEDHCSYTEGYERIGNNEEVLGNILSAIQHDPTNELLGAYSVATPGEMITMITFFKKVINVSEWERLKFILRDMDLGRMVVELSLARAIKALELHLLAMDDSTTWLFNNKELAVRKAGEVIDRTSYREALFKLLNAFKRDYSKQNNNFNRFNKFLREEMESVFKDEPEYFGKFDKYDEWNKYQNYSQGDWRSATANEVAGLKICVAKYPSMGVMATETLNEMNFNPEYIDNGKTSTEINPSFWAHIYVGLRYMNSLIKKDIALDSHSENMQKEVLRFTKYDDTLSWGVNMFSIIDAQSQEAIVYTGTLGSKFGALVEGGKGSFLNNLFYYSRFAFPNTGGHNNDLYPIIIYDNQQIRLAYSGNGGYTTRTAALPRMITVLALNIFFNQPIEEAITTPLIYPNYDGRLVSDGFPLNYGDILKVFKKEGNYVRISSDQYPGDSLVAIEQRKVGSRLQLIAVNRNAHSKRSNVNGL